jgi:hypothetical protein
MYASVNRLRLYRAKTYTPVSLTRWLGGTLSVRCKTAHIVSYSKVKVVSFHAKQAQRGGLDPDRRKGWVTSAKLEPLCSRRRQPVLILQEAGWTSGPENLVTTLERSRTINPVKNRYNDYAIAIIYRVTIKEIDTFNAM